SVNEVELVPLAAGVGQRRPCDVLCMSGGWSPAVHLTSHTGIKPVYRPDIAAFVPGGFVPNHVAAGAVTGEFSTQGAIHEGSAAGRKAASPSGHEAPDDDIPLLTIAGESTAIEPVWQAAQRSRGKAFVDFQNDVTLHDLSVAHQEGYQSVEHLKRYTTL